MEETLGARLARARIAHGLTGAQLAKLIGVSPSQVTRWEQNELTPTADSLVGLSEQLELRASELFTLAGRPIPADMRDIPAMLRAEYDLPASAIEEIEQHIREVARRYRENPTGRGGIV